MTTATYESCATTAQRIRQALKVNFPGVKFSVRSHTYSGGASVRVRWTDGPRGARVKPIAERYEGASFDGMVDLKSYHSSVVVDETGPREVHFGSDYVFCERTMSHEETLVREAEAMIRAKCRCEGNKFGGQWVEDLARGMAWDLDVMAGETLEAPFRRVVLRETPTPERRTP